MNSLEKTKRINMLMDLYGELLTEKQYTYLIYYYNEDYSLSEIAEEFSVSRNAVHDNLKRAEHILEDYESKLHLLEKHTQRLKLIQEIETFENQDHQQLYDYLEKIKNL
ncbi:MAG: YlxM family DNA-binding protein [Erysipelotrichaceae bacterium]|nr:YlxM family DNA-binding protein [Erysipelotrichaceae bacterium]